MIYLQLAMSCEAAPLIRALSLSAAQPLHGLKRWASQDVTLTLSGTGPYAACACAALTCAEAESAHDLFVTFGTCASLLPDLSPGTLYRIHALYDLASGRPYYPDMFPDIGLPEAGIITGARVLDTASPLHGLADCPPHTLYDMESAAAHLAASRFLGPHRQAALRLVSDAGESSHITQESIGHMVEKQLPALTAVLASFASYAASLEDVDDFTPSDEEVSHLCSLLRCSESMRLQLMQLMRYAGSCDISFLALLAPYIASGTLPVRDRKEGKRILEELTRLIST